MVKWIITKYQHSWVDSRLLVQLWTDERIHAYLHYSLSPERYSYTAGERRGVRRLVTPLWELPGQITIEQAQNGDTLSHAFYIPAIPNLATLTFYISATHNGVEAKSVAIPIKVVHPMQGGADEVDCPDLEDTLRFIPWESNQKDAIGIHDDIWNVSAMTGTGYFAYGMNQLSLIIGATPGSIAEIYAGDIFDLGFDHTLDSQLRAVVRFPIVDVDTVAFITHGDRVTPSGYGFMLYQERLYGTNVNSGGSVRVSPSIACVANTTYLLEAKYVPGERIEFWYDGVYTAVSTVLLPDTSGNSFHAHITDPDNASVAIHFRRFMVWKRSIWTGALHGV